MKERKRIISFCEKGCFKCENFRKHYVFARCGFTEASCGHCVKKLKCVDPDKEFMNCKYFEKISLKQAKAKRKKYIEDAILDIEHHLPNLIFLLKDNK